MQGLSTANARPAGRAAEGIPGQEATPETTPKSKPNSKPNSKPAGGTTAASGPSFVGTLQTGAVGLLLLADPAAAVRTKPPPPLQGIVQRLTEAGNEVYLPVDVNHGDAWNVVHAFEGAAAAVAGAGDKPVTLALEVGGNPATVQRARSLRPHLQAADRSPLATGLFHLFPRPPLDMPAMHRLRDKALDLVRNPQVEFDLLDWTDASRPQPVTAVLARDGVKVIHVGAAHAWGSVQEPFPFIGGPPQVPTLAQMGIMQGFPPQVVADSMDILGRASGGAVLSMLGSTLPSGRAAELAGMESLLGPAQKERGVRGAFIQYYVTDRQAYVYLEFPYKTGANMSMLVPAKYLEELKSLQSQYPKLALVCEGIPGCPHSASPPTHEAGL